MGWPYENYIDYDLANLDLFKTVEDFIHVTAHEIHHIYLGNLLKEENISGEAFFLQNFAYEGLAVHYNNNLGTLMKPRKYDEPTYMMEQKDMEFYEEHFDEIFEMIQVDYQACKNMSIEEVESLIDSKYHQFESMNRKVYQYPTYYFGCYMWGLVDLELGKEKVFEAIEHPELFV